MGIFPNTMILLCHERDTSSEKFPWPNRELKPARFNMTSLCSKLQLRNLHQTLLTLFYKPTVRPYPIVILIRCVIPKSPSRELLLVSRRVKIGENIAVTNSKQHIHSRMQIKCTCESIFTHYLCRRNPTGPRAVRLSTWGTQLSMRLSQSCCWCIRPGLNQHRNGSLKNATFN